MPSQRPVKDRSVIPRLAPRLAPQPAAALGISSIPFLGLPYVTDRFTRPGRVENRRRCFPRGEFQGVDEARRAVAQQRPGRRSVERHQPGEGM